MTVTAPDAVSADVVEYALRLGDDSLILAQQLAGWVTNAPELEEDVALANIALDLLGHARVLLDHAGQLEGLGRDEDALAFHRDERAFRCCQLVELPNGDFAQTIVRQLLVSTWHVGLYGALTASRDRMLAELAARAVKEVAYHREHAALWTVRLGDGTEESHRRAAAALDRVWPYAAELFETDPLTERLAAAGVAADPADLEAPWRASVEAVLRDATLAIPETTWRPSGGRQGRHLESFGFLLAEMQHLPRSHPGASW